MILQALNGYYDRVAKHEPDAIAERGYSDEKISFAVVLDREGRVIDVNDLRESTGRRPQPRIMQVPASFKRPGITPRSFFLWDKTAFALGVTEGDDDRPFELATKQLDAFKKLHLDKLRSVEDEGLLALRSFAETWSPERYATLRYADDMLDTNVVFRLDGDLGYIHERPSARDLWRRVRAESAGDHAICLVTGERGPIARIHPAIRGMPGQTMGGSIVSFNQAAFTSYEFEQGDNAPVSEAAAFAYTTALNRLLQRGSRNRVEIADASTVFWAEAAEQQEAEAAEQAVSWLFAPPPIEQQDVALTDRLKTEVMERVAKGRPLENPELKLSEGTRFYILGLVAPDPARLSVRFWEATTLGAVGRAFHHHLWDLVIEPQPWQQLPAIHRLLLQTAPLGDADRIPTCLAGEVMRAILTGRRYPQTLLSQALMRLRSDHTAKSQTRTAIGLRTALIKACISRDFRFGIEREDVPVSLDRSNTNAGYRLGRLFAVLEGIQTAALPGINATIRDRFYASAAAMPSYVFPILISKANHHLSNLKKAEKAGLAVWFEREIGEIMNGLDKGEFPPALALQDQGRFAIGYYQQRFTKRADAPAQITGSNASDTDA